jgi:hypothetical protein
MEYVRCILAAVVEKGHKEQCHVLKLADYDARCGCPTCAAGSENRGLGEESYCGHSHDIKEERRAARQQQSISSFEGSGLGGVLQPQQSVVGMEPGRPAAGVERALTSRLNRTDPSDRPQHSFLST